MTNEKIYRNEINFSNDYKISFNDFMAWIEKHNKKERLLEELKNEDIYFVAVDFSIPLIMVKKLKTMF